MDVWNARILEGKCIRFLIHTRLYPEYKSTIEKITTS